MKFNPVLILFILIILTESCLKERKKEITVDVIVVDALHDTPIEGVAFFLKDKDKHVIGYSDNQGVVKGSYLTNTNMIGYPKLFPYVTINSFQVAPGEKITGIIKMHPPGFYRIIFENMFPVDSNDVIGINAPGNPNFYYLYFGINVNDTIIFRREGEKNNEFNWKVSKSGNTIYFDTTMFVSEWDTIDLKIEY